MTHRTPHILKPLLVRQWGQRYPQRPSQDTALLKTLTEQLSNTLPRSPACMHLRGNGGLKQAICAVQAALPEYRYVFRTDVKSYYASINHHRLMDQLADHVTDRDSLNLLWQYMRRTVEYGGTFREIPCGIPAGCSLSPLIGAFHLHGLDVEMTRQNRGCFYIRYMDDFVFWSDSRDELRTILERCRVFLADDLALALKPPQLNHSAAGLPFLGFRLYPVRIDLGPLARRRFIRRFRAYEQRHVRGLWSEEELLAHVEPLLAFVKTADSLGFRRYVMTRYGVVT